MPNQTLVQCSRYSGRTDQLAPLSNTRRSCAVVHEHAAAGRCARQLLRGNSNPLFTHRASAAATALKGKVTVPPLRLSAPAVRVPSARILLTELRFPRVDPLANRPTVERVRPAPLGMVIAIGRLDQAVSGSPATLPGCS
jgi:hypothetical protein